MFNSSLQNYISKQEMCQVSNIINASSVEFQYLSLKHFICSCLIHLPPHVPPPPPPPPPHPPPHSIPPDSITPSSFLYLTGVPWSDINGLGKAPIRPLFSALPLLIPAHDICTTRNSVSVSVPVRQRIQMTGDENGVGGRVRFLAYWLVVIGVFDFGFEGRNGL